MANYDVPTFNPIRVVSQSTANPLSIGLQAASSIGGAALGLIGAKQQRDFESAEAAKERSWNEAMMDKENAWSLNMWNKTNEYNSPAEQLKRLREAGLNPMFYGLDGSSANGIQSAQALGYDRASASSFENPLTAGLEGALSGLQGANAAMQQQNANKSLQKDIELKNAQIDKIKADTTSVGLDNEWKDRTMEARTEAENLKNALTRQQITKINKEMDVMEQDIKKKIAETESEHERKLLIQAQAIVQKATAQEITEMLPYKKLLAEAQTEAQKASAALSWANAAYQRKLLSSGYVDLIVDTAFENYRKVSAEATTAAENSRRATAEANTAEAVAAVNAFKAAIKSGNAFSIDENEFFVSKYGKMVLNSIFQDISMVGEIVVGPIANLLK